MKKNRTYCIIILIMLCLMIVNFFLPIMSNGNESFSLKDTFSISSASHKVGYSSCGGFEGGNVFVLLATLLIYISPLLVGIINCILYLCNVCKNYKYALCSVIVPFIIYYLLLFIFFTTANGSAVISVGAILGPILSIASLVLAFVGNKKIENDTENNNENNHSTNAPIKE